MSRLTGDAAQDTAEGWKTSSQQSGPARDPVQAAPSQHGWSQGSKLDHLSCGLLFISTTLKLIRSTNNELC